MSEEPIADRLRRLCHGRAVQRVQPVEAEPRSESGPAGDLNVAAGPPAAQARAGAAESAAARASLAAGPPAGTTPSQAEVYARLSARRARTSATAPGEAPEPWCVEPPSRASDFPVRELSLEAPRDLVRTERGTSARTAWYERAHRHGAVALEEVLSIQRSVLAERARDARLAEVDLERAVYFDTETTGLSGGAGTYVFMVGLGRFVAGRFELWQGFLPHPAEEKVLLLEVAERIADASVLISFFGKSFDRHRLEDKMRLHGVTPPFASTIHLDLYHPLRRAHKGRFENCRLKTLERELVEVVRGDDLPGSFAPAAWFDFLGARPHRLEGVFRHNADDVLSLVALATHLAR